MLSGDYISKSALIKAIDEQVKGWGKQGIVPSLFSAIAIVQNQPTLDETEIIRKAFERVVECLNEKLMNADLECASWKDKRSALFRCTDAKRIAYAEAIEIVKEECGINE